MDLKKYNKAYFIGIGGIGVSAVCEMMLALSKNVLGSDANKSDITLDLEKRGVKVFYNHDIKNIENAKLDEKSIVIYTSAIPENNVELKRVKKLGIDNFTYFEFLGELSKHYKTIAISGTHGKSTTTALISLMMINAKLDPMVFIGSKILAFNSNFRLGKHKYLVVEGCEYKANMLKLKPEYIGLVSVDRDHLDYYKNLKNIKNAFQEFVDKLKNKENLIYNNDDINIKDLKIDKKSFGVGLNEDAKLFVSNVKREEHLQVFDLCKNENEKNKKICKIETTLPGYYNVYNILIASAIALKLGISPKIIAKTIKDFSGLWRRFEFMGKWSSNLIFSDYAHHPTAIKAVLSGARGFYSGKKIVIVFQPHQEDRTEKLFDEFLTSFELADDIIIYPIYKVSGRRSRAKKNSFELYRQIKKNYLKDDQSIFYSKDFTSLKKELKKYKDAVILVVGAGDIDNFSRHYIKYE